MGGSRRARPCSRSSPDDGLGWLASELSRRAKVSKTFAAEPAAALWTAELIAIPKSTMEIRSGLRWLLSDA